MFGHEVCVRYRNHYHVLIPILKELGLQAEDNFILKVVQLEELLHVRHSIFVIGMAGTGKTKILRSLNKTYQVCHIFMSYITSCKVCL